MPGTFDEEWMKDYPFLFGNEGEVESIVQAALEEIFPALEPEPASEPNIWLQKPFRNGWYTGLRAASCT